jgi:xylulose-5-phosphate/fructose-6-phosphate phosphoketolase
MKKRQGIPAQANRTVRNAKRTASTASRSRLAPDVLAKIDAYWRAANYLSVGQIYLDNALLSPQARACETTTAIGHYAG